MSKNDVSRKKDINVKTMKGITSKERRNDESEQRRNFFFHIRTRPR